MIINAYNSSSTSTSTTTMNYIRNLYNLNIIGTFSSIQFSQTLYIATIEIVKYLGISLLGIIIIWSII